MVDVEAAILGLFVGGEVGVQLCLGLQFVLWMMMCENLNEQRK